MRFAFQPTRFEGPWLESSLIDLATGGWLDEVLFRVSNGKEATVYCCRASEWTDLDLLAANVYRPRRQRAMRNYHTYRQANQVQARDRRLQRALARGTRKGIEAQDAEWVRSEHPKLVDLHELGAGVPRSLDCGPTAVLTEYIGDAEGAAPRLSDVAVASEQLQTLFERLLDNIGLFLARGVVHADLSAYNVLMWQGDPFIIDFPQAMDPAVSSQAFAMLVRDVERSTEYCVRQGAVVDPETGAAADGTQIARRLWDRYAEPGWLG